jgi:hypothetical protein
MRIFCPAMADSLPVDAAWEGCSQRTCQCTAVLLSMPARGAHRTEHGRAMLGFGEVLVSAARGPGS